MRRHLIIGVSICVLFGLACEESLPPRTLEDFLSPVFDPPRDLKVLTTRTDAGDTLVLGESMTAGLRNLSDEILEAPGLVRGDVQLTSLDDTTFHRSIHFELSFFDSVRIPPESLFTVAVVWDLRDDSCRYVYRMLRNFQPGSYGGQIALQGIPSLRFRASGTIQMFPNVESKDLPEVEFTRTYFFTRINPTEEFLNRVECAGLR